MANILRACPFCGNKDDFYRFYTRDGRYATECGDCLAHGPLKENETQAKKAWGYSPSGRKMVAGDVVQDVPDWTYQDPRRFEG